MSERLWTFRPAADFDRPELVRLGEEPRVSGGRGHGVRTLAALSLRAFLHTYHRLEIVGREHLPREGSFVLVANHSSHLDALCLLAALPLGHLTRTYAAAAEDYFFVNRRRVAMAGVFANAIPFARKVHLRRSLDLCRRVLAGPDNILILFPEGTRTTTGKLGEFRPGIGSLMAGTSIPVVACAIQGAYRAWPKGVRFPRPRGVRLVIGPPRSYAHLPPGRESSDRIARELHDVVQELLCQ